MSAPPIKTVFTDLCKVQYPIMQGGMHYVGYAEMAAAVSEAGGVGTITCLTMPDADALRWEIRKCRKLTSKPIAVNYTFLPMLNLAKGGPDFEKLTDIAIEENVPIIETAGNNPGEWIQKFKKAGKVVIHKCTTIKHALKAQELGADMISMDGFECGGHPGSADVTNFVLFPIAKRKLKIPFIASGSCVSGAQLAGALALGAEGMNAGTRFMATKEAPIKDGIKQALVKGTENDTKLVMRTVGNTERVFGNAEAQKCLETEQQFPGEFDKIADFVKGMKYKESFQVSGNPNDSIWSCGQGMGLIQDVPSCKDCIQDIMKECHASLARANGMFAQQSKL